MKSIPKRGLYKSKKSPSLDVFIEEVSLDEDGADYWVELVEGRDADDPLAIGFELSSSEWEKLKSDDELELDES